MPQSPHDDHHEQILTFNPGADAAVKPESTLEAAVAANAPVDPDLVVISHATAEAEMAVITNASSEPEVAVIMSAWAEPEIAIIVMPAPDEPVGSDWELLDLCEPEAKSGEATLAGLPTFEDFFVPDHG